MIMRRSTRYDATRKGRALWIAHRLDSRHELVRLVVNIRIDRNLNELRHLVQKRAVELR